MPNEEKNFCPSGFYRRWTARVLFRPTLIWNQAWAALGLRRWWDWIDDDVLLGAIPHARHVPLLKQAGIGAVVTVCGENPGPVAALRKAGLVQLRLTTPDFTPPTLEDVHRALDFMEEQKATGRKVYVHCKAGRGRSAIIVLCRLLASSKMTPEEAEEHIRRRRPQIMKNLAKRAVVRAFYQSLRKVRT
jgi:atypical dual specificity phosphatase